MPYNLIGLHPDREHNLLIKDISLEAARNKAKDYLKEIGDFGSMAVITGGKGLMPVEVWYIGWDGELLRSEYTGSYWNLLESSVKED